MPNYKCSDCNICSISKYDIEKHINLNRCKGTNPIVIIIENIIYNCIGCNKSYTTKPGLRYHSTRCEEIKKQTKPINILTTVQQQTGNEQLLDIIKNQQDTNKLLQDQINELKKNQKQTEEKVDRVIRCLSAWHSPYIFEDIYNRFTFSLEEGRTNMMLTFPTFVSEIYGYQENKTVCHKNKNINLVTCHENSKWSIIDSKSVYPIINNNLFTVYLAFLKSEPPYESKPIQKLKKIQLEYEDENRYNSQISKTRIKLIEGQFKSNNKQCNTTEVGKDSKDAIIAQNIEYILKAECNNFKDAFVKTKKKLSGTHNEIRDEESTEESLEDYIDDDNQDDEDFEHESDNFDSFYNEKGDFIGTDIEGIRFLKSRRLLINSRRANKNWEKELEENM